ncbi:MAG: ferritin-like domain-containing protein [Thermoleophilaceae bacterium]
MSEHLTLEVVDADAAIGDTRSGFFKKVAGGGALVVGGVAIGGLPKLAEAAPSARQDRAILNFALLLEYLEAAFYTEAENQGVAIQGELRTFAEVVGEHERAHRDFLIDTLGDNARDEPTFDFRDTTTDPNQFRQTAQALEDLGVTAYLGQATRLRRRTLAVAATIATVEARHASWIRDINRKLTNSDRPLPAPRAFDRTRTKRQVENQVEQTGFVQSS